MTTVQSWRGEGKAFRVNDLARLNGVARSSYKITQIDVHEDGRVEITAYGGTPGRMMTRLFRPEQLTKMTPKKATREGNAPWRATIHEVSAQSKKRKAGRRR